MEWIGYIGIGILVLLVLLVLVTNIQIVQQSRAYVVERLGAYSATWGVGLHFKIPFFERVVKKVSLKEQVADFDPQPVITKDNVTMQIDTVIYFQITDPKLYTYGVEHPMNAIENLTATTLRNIIGEMELDQSLTSRDVINAKMRSILDEATDPWGIKVNRVELKNILPPREIQNAMEKQMKAERERRESILQAEGQKQSQILVAEGEKQSTILRADAEKQAAILKAEAEAAQLLAVLLALRSGHAPAKPAALAAAHCEGEILLKLHVRRCAHHRVLEYAADILCALVVGQRGDVLAVEDDAPVVHRPDTGHSVEHGGFTGAVAADDRDEIAVVKMEVNAVERYALIYCAFIECFTYVYKIKHRAPPPFFSVSRRNSAALRGGMAPRGIPRRLSP